MPAKTIAVGAGEAGEMGETGDEVEGPANDRADEEANEAQAGAASRLASFARIRDCFSRDRYWTKTRPFR